MLLNSISHFIYADDVLVFLKAKPKSPKAIKTLIEKFSLFSEVKINVNKKSFSTFSKVYAENQSLHNILEYSIKSQPYIKSDESLIPFSEGIDNNYRFIL